MRLNILQDFAHSPPSHNETELLSWHRFPPDDVTETCDIISLGVHQLRHDYHNIGAVGPPAQQHPSRKTQTLFLSPIRKFQSMTISQFIAMTGTGFGSSVFFEYNFNVAARPLRRLHFGLKSFLPGAMELERERKRARESARV